MKEFRFRSTLKIIVLRFGPRQVFMRSFLGDIRVIDIIAKPKPDTDAVRRGTHVDCVRSVALRIRGASYPQSVVSADFDTLKCVTICRGAMSKKRLQCP